MIKPDLKPFSVREKILSFQRAITPKELQEILNVSKATISQQAKNGMPCIRFGGSLRFDPRELLAWMDS
jgi:excisionase family DNA binding protein